MNASKKVFISVLISVFVVSGCARYSIAEKQLDSIELSMDMDELQNALGKGLRRGSIQNKQGQTVEVWEYTIRKCALARIAKGLGVAAGTAAVGIAIVTGAPEKVINPMLGMGSSIGKKAHQQESDKYWFCFVDGKLVSWGQAGDWNTVQKQSCHIDFSAKNRLSRPSE